MVLGLAESLKLLLAAPFISESGLSVILGVGVEVRNWRRAMPEGLDLGRFAHGALVEGAVRIPGQSGLLGVVPELNRPPIGLVLAGERPVIVVLLLRTFLKLSLDHLWLFRIVPLIVKMAQLVNWLWLPSESFHDVLFLGAELSSSVLVQGLGAMKRLAEA